MTGLVIAFIGAAFWAGLDTTRKLLVRGMEPVAAAGWLALLNAPVFLGWALLAPDPTPTPGYWLPGGTALVLQVAANVLFFRALARLAARCAMARPERVVMRIPGGHGIGDNAVEWVES